MAAKKLPFNWDKLDIYLQFKSSKKMCALMLEVSEDTIERRIKAKYNCNFTDYAEKCIAPIKMQLVQKAIGKALKGENVMLIFCLKNLCSWRDKVETFENGDGFEFVEDA